MGSTHHAQGPTVSEPAICGQGHARLSDDGETMTFASLRAKVLQSSLPGAREADLGYAEFIDRKRSSKCRLGTRSHSSKSTISYSTSRKFWCVGRSVGDERRFSPTPDSGKPPCRPNGRSR